MTEFVIALSFSVFCAIPGMVGMNLLKKFFGLRRGEVGLGMLIVWAVIVFLTDMSGDMRGNGSFVLFSFLAKVFLICFFVSFLLKLIREK